MIKVKKLSKSYGKKKVLDNISFTVAPGEIISVIGENGSGKSTLLQIMAGVQRCDSGEIVYFGNRFNRHVGASRKYCGYLPQTNPLMEELSVRDNLKLWGGTKEILNKELIDRFKLRRIMEEKVKVLSGGMKRRVSFVAAIMHLPPILLLDEPTVALDIYHKEVIRGWINEYKQMNGITVMVTHEEKEIEKSDRSISLNTRMI